MSPKNGIGGDAYDRRRLHDLLTRSGRLLGAAEAPVQDVAGMPDHSSLERLLELGRRMNRIHDRNELLAYIRDRLSELFDAENSVVILVGRDGSLRVMDSRRDGGREISETLVRRVIDERRPTLVRDATQDPELQTKESVLELGLVSILGAPLIVEGEVIGVIEFDHRNQPKRFSEADLTLLGLFANQAATALDNVLLAEQRAEAEQKMREAQAQLVSTERLRALGQMAAGVSHDFNNLLASLLGLTELLLHHPETTEGLRPTVDRLHACALDGAGTVARIQEFAGGGAADGEPEGIGLEGLVRDVGEAVAHRFQDGSHRLHQTCADVPLVVGRYADLRDVVQNLVLNALEAMPAGGDVTMRTLVRDGRAVIEVEDTGEGIDPAVRERIFEPFFTTKGGRGHGLGLAICWSIINRMGGTIDIRPGAECGTVFVLDLPAAPDGVTDTRKTNADKADAPARGAARILLVDDEPTVRDVVASLLGVFGHEVTEAGGGAEALGLLDDGAFDILITDHGMPHMSGIELAEKARTCAPTTTRVLLTGNNPKQLAGETDGLFRLVLAKPLSADALRSAIEDVLGS